MNDLTYEQTIELEKNVKIKNEAEVIYDEFCKYVTVSVCNFRNGKFEIWSDSNNATYLSIINNEFVFQCRFLHETYDVKVNPSSLFGYIKSNYRGYDHFIAMVDTAKKENKNKRGIM